MEVTQPNTNELSMHLTKWQKLVCKGHVLYSQAMAVQREVRVKWEDLSVVASHCRLVQTYSEQHEGVDVNHCLWVTSTGSCTVTNGWLLSDVDS